MYVCVYVYTYSYLEYIYILVKLQSEHLSVEVSFECGRCPPKEPFMSTAGCRKSLRLSDKSFSSLGSCQNLISIGMLPQAIKLFLWGKTRVLM